MSNYYTETVGTRPHWPALENDETVDVAIVGAGITGVATAVELAERGFSVALVDAHTVGWGATGRNGGQVTGSLSGDNAMLQQLKKTRPSEAEQFVWDLRWRGHDIITQRIAKYDIDCGLKTGHIFTAWEKKDLPAFEQMVEQAHAYGMEGTVSLLNQTDVHDRLATPLYHGGVLNTKNLHLHSLKLCVGEAQAAHALGAKIFEHTPVTAIETINPERVDVVTPKGTLRASKVVLAGNAYHRLMRVQLGGYLFPAVLGNLVTEILSPELCQRINRDDNAVYDSRTVLDYYRITHDNRLMFGGGTNYSGRDIDDVASHLRPSLEATFPALKDVGIEHAWTGKAGIIINRIPMLGRAKPQVYFAQGYSGHGMATSHVLAEILATALAGDFEQLRTFEDFWRWRMPVPTSAGSALVALGMRYYQLKDQLG